MNTNIDKLAAYLKVVPNELRTISKSGLQFKPSPGKWSKLEILGHLIDSAVNNLQRFTNILFSPQPFVIHSYAQDNLVRINRYQHQPLEDLIQLWINLNKQILHLWKNYTTDQLNLLIENPHQNTSGNLTWLITDYIRHLEHHLFQIFGHLNLVQSVTFHQVSVERAENALNREHKKRFVTLMKHGTMLVEFYAPQKTDLQQPHRQDELYVIISGTGTFYNDGHQTAFQPGDVLFVPAGVEHRFENFTEDFKTWVIFYGTDGGEFPTPPKLEVTKTLNEKTYTISTDPARLDLNTIHQFLTHSYWGKGRTLAAVRHSIARSLNFGLYDGDKLIGYARLITDYTVFNYLADVFILEACRGKGLGKMLIDTIMSSEPVNSVGKCMLHTKDAHGLYEHFDFKVVDHPEIIMSRGYSFE